MGQRGGRSVPGGETGHRGEPAARLAQGPAVRELPDTQQQKRHEQEAVRPPAEQTTTGRGQRQREREQGPEQQEQTCRVVRDPGVGTGAPGEPEGAQPGEGRAGEAVAAAELQESGDEQGDTADIQRERDGIGRRHPVHGPGVTDPECQQRESQGEMAEGGGAGVSRRDVVVHGGLPSHAIVLISRGAYVPFTSAQSTSTYR